MGATRGELRGGARVDLLVPGSPVGCRGQGSGLDANPNPDRSITCNRTARCRGEAKSWPYRPKGLAAGCPGLHPGLVELALQAGIAWGHCCVSGLKGQLCQRGMKCQVRRSQGVVALQGQLLAGLCRVVGGPQKSWVSVSTERNATMKFGGCRATTMVPAEFVGGNPASFYRFRAFSGDPHRTRPASNFPRSFASRRLPAG
jgi:hypothetical protein